MKKNLGRHVSALSGARPRPAFNLVELIAVLAVMGLLTVMSFPALTRILQRERVESFLRSASLSLERAKGEAAKRQVPVVVRADYPQNALYGFADLDRDGVFDGGEPELFFLVLPAIGAGRDPSLRFWSAEEDNPEGKGAVFGFSADPTAGDFPNQAILEPDGSARAAGAFRFGLAGTPGNFYELRVEPAVNPRVELRKYLLSSPPAFLARQPGDPASWPWY